MIKSLSGLDIKIPLMNENITIAYYVAVNIVQDTTACPFLFARFLNVNFLVGLELIVFGYGKQITLKNSKFSNNLTHMRK